MCLGVPGRVVEVHESPVGMTMGRVSFGGIEKDVCLAYLDDVRPDEWVVVHVGFAISRIDEAEAARVFDYLEEMNELDEIHVPQPEGSRGLVAPPLLPERDGS
jgi:hydrogenase expression/formation protein HypC